MLNIWGDAHKYVVHNEGKGKGLSASVTAWVVVGHLVHRYMVCMYAEMETGSSSAGRAYSASALSYPLCMFALPQPPLDHPD